MKYRGVGIIKNIFYVLFMFFVLICFPMQLSAKVTGSCVNCHTMHNSQGNSAVLRSGAGVGWGADNKIGGGSPEGTPAQNLLVAGCVGCHSSTTGKTIIEAGSSTVPIVYNVSGPTEQYLAGGNFYWVAQGDNSKGHNVYGLAGQDTLTTAPGKTPAGCANSCHETLAAAPSSANSDRGGCQGCHVFTYHHEDNGVYRFLKGHGEGAALPINPANKNISSYTDYVKGVEDNDWEQETANDHNWYKGSGMAYYSDGSGLTYLNTISSFCSGCHSVFHGPYNSLTKRGMGGGAEGAEAYPGSPWRRHPTDIKLPDTGEYGNYDPDIPSQYSALAPVAWTDPSSPSRSGAVVMCLSCHRAHGSPYSDLLRWDYLNNCNAGTNNSNCGCFTCHTEKDGL